MSQRIPSSKKSTHSLDNKASVPTHTIARVVDILKTLREGTQGVTDISRRLGMSKATISRLLRSLELTKLVMRDPASRQYCLGPLAVMLASDYLIAHQNLCICARNEMESLWHLSRETVCLEIQVGTQGMYLEEYVSPQGLRYARGKGTVTPLYVGSGGKVILSELTDNMLNMILKNISLEPIGPRTILDKEALIREIEQIRKQGYSISVGEKAEGGAGIAVPIRNYVCPVALCIIGPETRIAPEMVGLLEELKGKAVLISQKLLEMYGSNSTNDSKIEAKIKC